MFCCAAFTDENPCFPDCEVPVSVNGTAVAGSGVTAVVVGSEFTAVTFNGTTALPEGTTGFSRDTAVVPVGIAVLFAALPAGEAVAALPAAPCGETDTLDAGAFFWLFA